MKKLLWIVGIVVVLVLAAFIGSTFFLGSVVRVGVNTFGPKLTQTRVELAGARISPFSGSGTLTGLLVGNPPGWKSDRAFYLGKIHVAIEPSSLFGKHLVIDDIAIDQPQFVYETRIVSSNIKELLNNLEAATGGSGATAASAGANGPPRKFEVKKFTLTGGQVTLGVGPTALTIPMPPISLENIGVSEGGITADQLALVTMRAVLGGVVQAAAHAALQAGSAAGSGATGEATEALKKAGAGLKGLFDGGGSK